MSISLGSRSEIELQASRIWLGFERRLESSYSNLRYPPLPPHTRPGAGLCLSTPPRGPIGSPLDDSSARARCSSPAGAMLPLAHAVQTAFSLPAAALSELQRQHYTVVPDFVPPAVVSTLVKDVALLHAQDCFTVAEVGEDGVDRVEGQVEDGVRRCEQCYLYPEAAAVQLSGQGDPAARRQLIDTLDGVRECLSVLRLDAGLKPLTPSRTEGLYVYYPNGGFYRRHRDAAP